MFHQISGIISIKKLKKKAVIFLMYKGRSMKIGSKILKNEEIYLQLKRNHWFQNTFLQMI